MLRSPLAWLFARAAWGPAWTTGGLALVLLALAGLGQALSASSVVPGPALLGRLALGVVGSVLPLALAVGALAGAAGGVARLREERTLLGLASLGLSPRSLGGLCAVGVLPVVVMYAGLTHYGEPLARALVRDTRVAAAAAVSPREGRPVRLGSWWVALDEGALVFTDGSRTGRADGWAWAPRAGGVLAELSGVDLTFDGADARLETLSLPVPVGNRGKVHVSERTTPDLREQLLRSAALGRDAAERWLLWKRTLLPLALVPLSVAAAGFARRRSPGWIVGALLLGSWVAVRLLDAQEAALGPALSGTVFLAGTLATAIAAWWRPGVDR